MTRATSLGVYSYCITDTACNAAGAYVYLTLFNPAASGRLIAVRRADYNSYAVAAALTKISIRISRISAHSLGSLAAANTYGAHDTNDGAASAVIRYGGVTVTQVADIKSISPPICITAAGTYPATEVDFNPRDDEEDIILREGEGVCFYQAAAQDADGTLNLRWMWEEYT